LGNSIKIYHKNRVVLKKIYYCFEGMRIYLRKFKIIKNGESIEDQKERIKNLMTLAPIQIMNMELDNS
jgi:hypothetical protein